MVGLYRVVLFVGGLVAGGATSAAVGVEVASTGFGGIVILVVPVAGAGEIGPLWPVSWTATWPV